MLYRLLILLLALALAPISGCARKRHQAHRTTSPTEALAARVALYKSLAPQGWDISSECDALLFVTLQQVGLGIEGPVDEAESEPGKWNRLPAPDYATNCSSDISRDMFMGLFVWAWEFKRLDVLERVWSYGVENNWHMGQERKAEILENRTYFLPGTIALLAELIYHLGGDDHVERNILVVTPMNTEPGFASHLSLLQIYLRGEMHDGLTDGEILTLDSILLHMSGNPLAHALLHKYTDGNQSRAVQLLLETWPADRLPTDRDWDDSWRTQRSDDDSGLMPGDSDEQHSGGDFLFAAHVILGS